MDTNPLQWAQVQGRKELVSWKSCLTSVSTSTTPDVVSGWVSSTATSPSARWWINLSSSCLGAPNTASTMSFIRSSSVFFRSQLPDSSCSLLIELSRIEWISDVMHVDATDVDDGDITSCTAQSTIVHYQKWIDNPTHFLFPNQIDVEIVIINERNGSIIIVNWEYWKDWRGRSVAGRQSWISGSCCAGRPIAQQRRSRRWALRLSKTN